MVGTDHDFKPRVHPLIRIAAAVGPILLLGGPTAAALSGGGASVWPIFIVALPGAVLLAMISSIRIRVSGGILEIRYVLFGVRIPIPAIQVVNDTATNPRLTMFALNFATSPGWLEIGYLQRGKVRWVTTSPTDKIGLMRALASEDVNLVLTGSKLERRP